MKHHNIQCNEIPLIQEKIFNANRSLYLENGKDLYSQLIDEFKDNVILFLKWIQSAIRIGDEAALEQYLRTFKGSCQLVAAARLSTYVATMLNQVAEGFELELGNLKELTEEVQKFLDEVDNRLH